MKESFDGVEKQMQDVFDYQLKGGDAVGSGRR